METQMNENAMWELAAFLKQAAESPSANTTAPEWLSELNGLPVEDYAQDLCRVLRIGLFNGLPEISESQAQHLRCGLTR